jgi:uncharacterized Zn-finger protein
VCAACYQQICHWIKFAETAAKSQNKTSTSGETVKKVDAIVILNLSEIDLVKIYKLKPLSVSITRLSDKDLDRYKNRKFCKVQKNEKISTFKVKQTKMNSNTCYVCDKTYSYNQNLRRHIRDVHEAVHSFHCNQCDKSFVANEKLKRRLKIHSNVRPFKCDKCSMSFIFNYDLKHHNIVHSDVRAFKCKKCKASFKLESYLLQHDSKVHSDARPFACQVCGKMFKSKCRA